MFPHARIGQLVTFLVISIVVTGPKYLEIPSRAYAVSLALNGGA